MHRLTDEEITAAPMPLTLRQKGKEPLELLMSPLRDIDFSSLNQWLRHKIISFAYENLPPKNAENMSLREEIIGVATKQAASISWHSPDGIKMLETGEGMARVVWQCCKHNCKHVLTHEELIPYFNHAENIMAYGRVFVAVNPELVEASKNANKKFGIDDQVMREADTIEFPELKPEKKGSQLRRTKKQKSIDF